MEEWLGLGGLSYDLTLTPKGEYLDGEFKYVPPKRLEMRVNNLNIAFYHNLHVSGDMFFNIHMNQTTFLEIIPDQPMSIDDYRNNIIYHLRNFLSLGTGRAVSPIVMKGRIKNCTIESSTGESTPRDVYIFYAGLNSRINTSKQFTRRDMLFNYQDVTDNLSVYIQKWFEMAIRLRPVFDLYFGIFDMPFMYIQLQFLTLSQALETYHRRKYDGFYMAVEKYESIEQILIQAIPVDLDNSHRDSLKSRIKYGYEYSLRKRLELILKEVLEPYKRIIDRLIGNRGEFIDKVVKTRNYLTHYTEDLEQTAITDLEEQYKLVQKMKLLIQLCFLIELTLSPETVEKLSQENRKFQEYMRME